jgi:hypothetical protein
VRNPQGQFQRVFSGWLYKETPSLNVVEHPIYDVWPKSCEMTHPGGGEPVGRSTSNRSSAANSTEPEITPAPAAPPAPEPPAAAPAEPPPSADANSAR